MEKRDQSIRLSLEPSTLLATGNARVAIAWRACIGATCFSITALAIGATTNDLSKETNRLLKSLSESKETALENSAYSVGQAESEGKISHAEAVQQMAVALRKIAGKHPFEAKINEWLSPSAYANSGNAKWWAFYREAIWIAQQVDKGKLDPEDATNLIDRNRLALNEATDKPADMSPSNTQAVTAPILLNCVLSVGDMVPKLPYSVKLDYAKSTANGYSARITDTSIRFASPEGNEYFINRTTGQIIAKFTPKDIATFYLDGTCSLAVKQF